MGEFGGMGGMAMAMAGGGMPMAGGGMPMGGRGPPIWLEALAGCLHMLWAEGCLVWVGCLWAEAWVGCLWAEACLVWEAMPWVGWAEEFLMPSSQMLQLNNSMP